MSTHGHKVGDWLSDAELGAIAQEAGALLERTAQYEEEEQVQPVPARETIPVRSPDGPTARMPHYLTHHDQAVAWAEAVAAGQEDEAMRAAGLAALAAEQRRRAANIADNLNAARRLRYVGEVLRTRQWVPEPHVWSYAAVEAELEREAHCDATDEPGGGGES
jgi:hypothetical protein